MAENIEFLKEKAEQGEAEALYQLGNYYQKGDGVEQNWAKAFELWEKAAEL